MRMRALIQNGALALYGGGERYTFALADVLSERYDVVLATGVVPDARELKRRGFPSGYEIRSMSNEQLTRASRQFDLDVRTRWSPPLQPSHADRTAVVVQFPSTGLAPMRRPRAFLRQRRAMPTFDTYITYSNFCARFVTRRWGVDSEVVHPPAALGQNPPSKEPGILAISRFEPAKRHAVLVQAYKALPGEIRDRHPLHLVGGCGRDTESQAYLAELRATAGGQNVHFHPNASQDELDHLLQRMTLFWHAKGYERPSDRPDLAEHFGIVAVEAMSHGLVPLVVDDGGLPEIVDSSCGVLWRSAEDLVSATCELIRDDHYRAGLARTAIERSETFSRATFETRVRDLFS